MTDDLSIETRAAMLNLLDAHKQGRLDLSPETVRALTSSLAAPAAAVPEAGEAEHEHGKECVPECPERPVVAQTQDDERWSRSHPGMVEAYQKGREDERAALAGAVGERLRRVRHTDAHSPVEAPAMTEDADRIEQWQRLALEQTRIAQKWSMRALGAEADLAAWQQEKRLGWLHHVGVGEDSTLHVWPKGEAHLTEPADPYCPCLPELYETTGGIVISVHREGIMP